MRISREDSLLLVVDVQERLFPVMSERDAMLSRVVAAIRGAGVLGLPTLVTEQYPKGLGPTLPAINDALESIAPIEKIDFSCARVDVVRDKIVEADRTTILVCGIEAHVCVQQTCLDLLEEKLQPVVLADCVSSRKPYDRDVAIERMRDAGVMITTLEAALFEMLGAAGTDEFKAISKLVKEL
ncbi:MAG: hydrolase [Spirochaetales bacterium]